MPGARRSVSDTVLPHSKACRRRLLHAFFMGHPAMMGCLSTGEPPFRCAVFLAFCADAVSVSSYQKFIFWPFAAWQALCCSSAGGVGQGSALVDKTGTTMTEVVTDIRSVMDIMGEISAASRARAMGLAQAVGHSPPGSPAVRAGKTMTEWPSPSDARCSKGHAVSTAPSSQGVRNAMAQQVQAGQRYGVGAFPGGYCSRASGLQGNQRQANWHFSRGMTLSSGQSFPMKTGMCLGP